MTTSNRTSRLCSSPAQILRFGSSIQLAGTSALRNLRERSIQLKAEQASLSGEALPSPRIVPSAWHMSISRVSPPGRYRHHLLRTRCFAAPIFLHPRNTGRRGRKSTFEAVGLVPGFFVVVHCPDRAKRTPTRRCQAPLIEIFDGHEVGGSRHVRL